MHEMKKNDQRKTGKLNQVLVYINWCLHTYKWYATKRNLTNMNFQCILYLPVATSLVSQEVAPPFPTSECSNKVEQSLDPPNRRRCIKKTARILNMNTF